MLSRFGMYFIHFLSNTFVSMNRHAVKPIVRPPRQDEVHGNPGRAAAARQAIEERYGRHSVNSTLANQERSVSPPAQRICGLGNPPAQRSMQPWVRQQKIVHDVMVSVPSHPLSRGNRDDPTLPLPRIESSEAAKVQFRISVSYTVNCCCRTLIYHSAYCLFIYLFSRSGYFVLIDESATTLQCQFNCRTQQPQSGSFAPQAGCISSLSRPICPNIGRHRTL
jgi:hypothetical protein